MRGCANAHHVPLNFHVCTGTWYNVCLCIGSGGWDDSSCPWRRSLWHVMDFLVDLRTQTTRVTGCQRPFGTSPKRPTWSSNQSNHLTLSLFWVPLSISKSVYLTVFSSHLFSYSPSASPSLTLPLFSVDHLSCFLSFLTFSRAFTLSLLCRTFSILSSHSVSQVPLNSLRSYLFPPSLPLTFPLSCSSHFSFSTFSPSLPFPLWCFLLLHTFFFIQKTVLLLLLLNYFRLHNVRYLFNRQNVGSNPLMGVYLW